ncbi:MAG: hypothetical protein QOF50_1460 [Gaiellaceae bacterium]|nr:hypothetical protein [Gaiellaceae bacterium]
MTTRRQMLNKVPEVALYFWIIKVLCTTVGETASDFLAGNLNLGLTKTTFITGALLLVTLFFQFRAWRYIPGIYWLGVVLISVVGTQITDNLTDNFGVSLVTTTIVFSVALAVVFAAWYASERTLSIHTIYTTRREGFYWLAVLFTFALGTAAGDLAAERLSLGYWLSAVIFAAVIAAVAIAHYRFQLNAVAAFWIAYILTRPLGASLGDFLSQARADGGLGLGTTVTSALFLGAILVVVTYLSITRKDATEAAAGGAQPAANVLVVAHRTAATPTLLEAIRARAAQAPAGFHLLVPNPAGHAEVTDAEREKAHLEGEHVLALALPLIDQAGGNHATGSVSIRHDPMDAIEETLHDGDFHEIILSTLPRSVSRWLHVDLPSRVEHLGLPVTTVIAEERAAA